MRKERSPRIRILAVAAVLGAISLGAVAAAPAPDGDPEPAAADPGVVDIVFGGSALNLAIWAMLFGTSCATVWFVVDTVCTIRRPRVLPDQVVTGVSQALAGGDLSSALDTCEANPGPLSTILLAGFGNIAEGYDVVQESVASSAELENEKLMQRVNYLNLCGQIAPMLGLMGTVTGMVAAFSGLATLSGAAKGKVLAMAISEALWTTCAGLLVAVPALLAFTVLKNRATRLVLETEATVLDLIKVLRNARVETEVHVAPLADVEQVNLQ